MIHRGTLIGLMSFVYMGLGAPCADAGSLHYDGSDLRLWLRADKDVTVDTVNFPGRVIGWADQTGFGGNTTAQDGVGPSGVRPILVQNVLNGQPVVRFDASQRRIDGPAAHAAGGGDKTIVLVASSNTAGNQIIFDPNGQQGSPFPGELIRITPEMNIRYGNGFTDVGGGALTSFEMITVQTGATHGDTMVFRGDTMASLTHSAAGNPVNTQTVGYRMGGATDWRGDIAEVLVFQEKLSPENFNAVGFYLQEKYGFETSFTNPIPEPATPGFALLGAAGLLLKRRRTA